MATIKQIASLAGVSRGTVDRVLNNRGIVNPATAARVREIAETLHYTPNAAGKNLSIRKKNLKLGFVMFGGGGNPFFDDVVTGIHAKAELLAEYGVGVETRISEIGDHKRQIALLEELVCSGVQGIAITPVNHPALAEKMRELAARDIALVTVNTDIEHSGRLAYVGSDFRQSGKTAGRLMGLIAGGAAHVGVITGSSSVLCHTERIAGFRRVLGKYYPGAELVGVVENHDDDFESFAVTKELLTAHPEIDALYLAAAGVYGACRAVLSMGLQGKLRIISHDYVPNTKKLLREGVIAATIGQQPLIQGGKPLDILFDYLTRGTVPDDCYYTAIEIRIRENM